MRGKDCLTDATVAAVEAIEDARAPVHQSGWAFGRYDFSVWLCDSKFAVRGTHEYAGPNKSRLTQNAIVQYSLVMSSQNIHFLLMFCQLGRRAC